MKKLASLGNVISNRLVWLLFMLTLSTPQVVRANQVFGSDGSFGIKDTFFDNQVVYASGDVDFNTGEFIFPQGNVCVVPAGISVGQAISDVTLGGCNLVVGASLGGVFFDEPVWLPPLTPGNYDLVLDDNRNGVFDATDAKISIVVLSSGGGAPAIDVAALKSAAGKLSDDWEAVAFHGRHLSDYSSAIALGWAVATGDVIGGVANAVSLGASLGFGVDIPLDYNSAVLIVGGKIIDGLAGPQARKYADLEADPADPLFTDFAVIDMSAINVDLAALAPLYPAVPLQYPFKNLSRDPLHLAQTILGNAMAEEAAMVIALRQSLEKFEGAKDASNNEFMFLQARAAQKYANLLANQLVTTRQGVLDYQAELAADGLDTVSYDGTDIAAVIDRLLTTGLTPDEEQNLRNVGFNDADFSFLFDRIHAFPAPTGIFTRGGLLDNLVSSIDLMLPAVQHVADQAQDVMTALQGTVNSQHPTAIAGGPYLGTEGVALTFDGTGSSDPTGQLLSYAWDFDLDGEFDDATGAIVTKTYDAPFSGKVGLKVTDPDGDSDIAYATVQIADVNRPPEITAFAPADLAPTASSLSPLDFSATATDPDAEPVTYEWRLDGVVVSMASAWKYTPGIGETGTRSVRLTVSDGSPLSEDAVEIRLVRLSEEVLVPDVVGLSQAAAESAILSANLTVGAVTIANGDTVPAGDVIEQNPSGGGSVAPGTAVDLVISVGPAGEPPTAPQNLIGRAKRLHVNLSWFGSAEATGYFVFRRLNSETAFTPFDVNAATVFVDDMPENTTFAEYYVIAENGFGQSDPSAIVMIRPTRR